MFCHHLKGKLTNGIINQITALFRAPGSGSLSVEVVYFVRALYSC